MKNLEKRLSQLEESQPIANVRPLTDAERAVRIVRMLATEAPGCERVRKLVEASKNFSPNILRKITSIK